MAGLPPASTDGAVPATTVDPLDALNDDIGRRVGALLKSGVPAEMLAAAEQLARDNPNQVASLFTLAVMRSAAGDLAEAERLLRLIAGALPGFAPARYQLAMTLLAQGRYAEAWTFYDARVETRGIAAHLPRDFPYPRWIGQDLRGKRLTLFPEQGYGDQIQFARFLPTLVGQGANITLLTRPALVRLFEHNFPDIDVVEASGTVSFPDPDYWATTMDLPARLGVLPEQLRRKPYLTAPDPQPEPTGPLRVGLVTAGNAAYGMDRFRSLTPDFADELRRRLPQPVVDLSPESTGASDFADTAAIISGLDLVVSVDTSVAHLAGAMGKKTFLLVPGFGTDWRWMRDRIDSPWYPQHRIYRGTPNGDWRPAIDAAVRDAGKLALPIREYMRDATRLREQGRFDEALAMGRKAIAADPQHPGALHNVARLLTDMAQAPAAEPLQRKAIALAPHHPDFQYGLGINLLAQGRYREGWPLYKARSRIPDLDGGFPQGVAFPRWQGELLENQALAILPEQGLGDHLQFARFLPWAATRCRSLALLVPPPLTSLFERAFPDARIIAAVKNAAYPRSDAWTTLVDLARLAGASLDALPPGDYLKDLFAGGGDPAAPRSRALRIGLMTQGNSKYSLDRYRSLPASEAARLRAELPGELVELAPEASGARDFLDTARIMATLDLIVSVDTSVGHLAGAMGKPCFLLVNGFATDWRWMRERSTSPWYPGHRLYRGDIDGGWSKTITRLLSDAKKLAHPQSEKSADPLGRRAAELKVARRRAEEAPTAENTYALGKLLSRLGRLEEAEIVLRQSVSRSDDGKDKERFALGLNLLAQGRYREAWAPYNHRRNIPENTGYPVGVVEGPRWSGESLIGKKLLVIAEQGLGDALQLARFLPQLVERGATVTLYERSPLRRLLADLWPGVRVCDNVRDVGQQDLWTTLFDILEPLSVSSETLPPGGYLGGRYPARDSHDFAVGLCTKGNPAHTNDAERTLPDGVAARLEARLPGRVLNLDTSRTGASDFAETAALMAELDLIVSVDTAVGHLAGTMGKACLLLLPGFGTDWRWMRGRSDSPWYPHHRLYRSTVDGDWTSAIDAVIAEAERRAAHYSATRG